MAAPQLACIDMDVVLWIEYRNEGRWPLALIETAMDVGQQFKPATVTQNMAKLSGLPAYTCLYTLSKRDNPADPRWKDIERFRIKCLHPTEDKTWQNLSPYEWCRLLLALRNPEQFTCFPI